MKTPEPTKKGNTPEFEVFSQDLLVGSPPPMNQARFFESIKFTQTEQGLG